MKFFNVRVANIRVLTRESKEISLHIPNEIKDEFTYQAGQYITVRKKGEDKRRSYSICSAQGAPFSIAVKKVIGGYMSTYLTEELTIDDELEISKPEGHFVSQEQPDNSRVHYFIGVGSGITPLMSMIQHILLLEPLSSVHLLFGNRTEADVMFKEDLDKLTDEYEGQLTVTYVYSKSKQKGWISKLLQKDKYTGRITSKVIDSWLSDYVAYGRPIQFYLCGPGGFIDTADKHLKSLGIPRGNISKEYFNTDHFQSAVIPSQNSGISKVKVHLYGNSFELETDYTKTLLEAIEDRGYDPPYSCRAGSCSSCMARVDDGKVNMDVCLALSDAEVEDGYILTCQARVASHEVEIIFE